MGIMPRLVGGIEVRERKPRYEGEPRYKRLDFVKSKKSASSDDYSLIRTTYPRPQAPAYGAPWQNPHWQTLTFEQKRQLLADLGYQHYFPDLFREQQPHHGHEEIRPPSHHHGLEHHHRRQIGGPEDHPGDIVHADPPSDDSDDDAVIMTIEPRRHRPRHRHRPAGHSIFGSDDEDDRHSRFHGSAGSVITSSSVGSSVSSRHRRHQGLRGWGG